MSLRTAQSQKPLNQAQRCGSMISKAFEQSYKFISLKANLATNAQASYLIYMM